MYCGQTAGWIKMPLGTEVGLGPGHIVLDGDRAPLPQKGHSPQIFGPCLLWPNGWIDQDTTSLSTEADLDPGHIVSDGDPATSKRERSPQFSAHVYCGQKVAHLS